MLNILPTKEEQHVEKLLERVRVAKKLGQLKKLRYWAGAYLKSLDARRAAVQTANRRRKLSDRLDTATVRKIAAGLDAWKGTDEPVVAHLEKKDSTPVSFRTYMAFGIENKAPLIAETMLAMALQAVPKLGDIVAYGDNCLLMAKEESDVVTMMKALETAFQAHPVGLLKPKRKLFKPGEPIDFLGHRLIPHHGKIRIEPSQKRMTCRDVLTKLARSDSVPVLL